MKVRTRTKPEKTQRGTCPQVSRPQGQASSLPKIFIALLLAAICAAGGIKAGPTVCQFVRTNSQVVDFQPQFGNQGQILFQPQLSGQTAPEGVPEEKVANPAPPVQEPAPVQPPTQFPYNPYCGPCYGPVAPFGWGW